MSSWESEGALLHLTGSVYPGYSSTSPALFHPKWSVCKLLMKHHINYYPCQELWQPMLSNAAVLCEGTHRLWLKSRLFCFLNWSTSLSLASLMNSMLLWIQLHMSLPAACGISASARKAVLWLHWLAVAYSSDLLGSSCIFFLFSLNDSIVMSLFLSWLSPFKECLCWFLLVFILFLLQTILVTLGKWEMSQRSSVYPSTFQGHRIICGESDSDLVRMI